MSKQLREKIALVVFAALIIFAGIVLTSYFSTGRSWTRAATFVDETLGNMDGYTGIVFNGVIPVIDEEDEDDTVIMSSGSVFEMVHLATLPFMVPSNGLFDGIYLSDVRNLYEEKGARVISLDLRNASSYVDPTVLRVGSKRIGVFSILSYARQSQIEEKVLQLREGGADTVICITPREALISDCEGIDILLLTEDPVLTNVHLRSGDTTIVTAPTIGEIGVILFSSNNVPLVRRIDSL